MRKEQFFFTGRKFFTGAILRKILHSPVLRRGRYVTAKRTKRTKRTQNF